MKAQQLHYTSCRQGTGGGAGFQTRALSQGLTPGEQRELERRGLYRPPRDAALEPTSAQIASDFPRAFRFHILDSGRLALTHSCYAGRDYSGRWGNFFAHSLVLPAKTALPGWPIDFFEWEGWKERLEPGEDSEELPPPLSEIEIEKVVPAESFTLEELGTFLREKAGRTEQLARMGRAVLLGRQDSRPLVVRDSPTHCLYWIACLQKLFPPAHAQSLGWSTYQDDPRGCLAVNATSGETDLSFDEAERRYRFYMFDQLGGVESEVPASQDDYPARAATWLAENPARLGHFFDFTRRFAHRSIDPTLVAALHWFELVSAPEQPFDPGRLLAMVDFASDHAGPGCRAELVAACAAAGVAGVKELPSEAALRVLRFLASGAAESRRPELRAIAFEAWRALFTRVATENPLDIATAEQGWNVVETCFEKSLAELGALVLAVERAEGAWQLASTDSPAQIFALRILWRSLELTGHSPVWREPALKERVTTLASRAPDLAALGQRVLAAIPAEAAAFAEVARWLATARPKEDSRREHQLVGRGLARVLETLPPAKARETRHQLDTEPSWELLLGEWMEICDRATDPLAALASYRQTVTHEIPHFGRARWTDVLSYLLSRLPREWRIEMAVGWVMSGEAGTFPAPLAQECLGLANAAILLKPRDQRNEALAARVSDIARERGIQLRPDRPALLSWLVNVRRGSFAITGTHLAELRRARQGLTEEDYRELLAGLLPSLLGQATKGGEHERYLIALFDPTWSAPFEDAYVSFLAERRRSAALDNAVYAALLFWVGFDPTRVRDLAPLEVTARKLLARLLAALRSNALVELKRQLRRDSRAAAGRRWQAIEEEVEQAARSPWRRLLGFLRAG